MFAEFCSDKNWTFPSDKNCDKYSVRVRCLQSDEKSEWRKPTMGPPPPLSQQNNSDKNRTVCTKCHSDKKNRKEGLCALTQSYKIRPALLFFLGGSYDKKSVHVRWALMLRQTTTMRSTLVWKELKLPQTKLLMDMCVLLQIRLSIPQHGRQLPYLHLA